MALSLSRLAAAALIARTRTLAAAALRFSPHPWPEFPHPRAPNAIGSPSILHGNRSLFGARLFSSPVATAHGSPSSSPSPQDLIISDNCVKRLQEIMQEEKNKGENIMLRVSVEGGGCSGFQYIFALENKQGSSDRVFEKDGVKVVVDNISMDFLKGATIDYIEELIRTSFMVTQNPNASGGCGCGSSFNVK